MIHDWDEINSRFDAIKDHRPKAGKKLNELGDILASAYKLDPVQADKMWQYLINLNVSDTPENAKFYIAQVFNKLTDRLAPEEATELLAMTSERVRAMVLYGYEGKKRWDCLSALIKGFLKLGTVDNCIITIKFYFEKLEQLNLGYDPSLSVVANSIQYADELYKAENQYKDIVIEFMHKLLEIENGRINAYTRISMVILGYEECEDSDELINLANEYKLASEFIELLWNYRDKMSKEEFAEHWVNYLENLDDKDTQLPVPNFEEEEEQLRNKPHSDKPYYEGTKMEFFVSMMKDNDKILPYYFKDKSKMNEYIIYSWITENDWERFTRYISQNLENAQGEFYGYSDTRRYLEDYMKAYFYSEYIDSFDNYGRSKKIITKENLSEFESALSSISATIKGCVSHDDFHKAIKEFIQKASGNIDALIEAGFDEKIDERSAEQRFKDYVVKFLQSGELEHIGCTREYRRLIMSVREEASEATRRAGSQESNIDLSGAIKRILFEEMVKDGTLSEKDRKTIVGEDTGNRSKRIDYYMEQNYRQALDDDIAKFYFLHSRSESAKKADMIAACIKKENLSRARKLVDLLLQTTEYENFSAPNSWASEMKKVAEKLAETFVKDGSYILRKNEITDEQVQIAYQLIEKIKLIL